MALATLSMLCTGAVFRERCQGLEDKAMSPLELQIPAFSIYRPGGAQIVMAERTNIGFGNAKCSRPYPISYTKHKWARVQASKMSEASPS